MTFSVEFEPIGRRVEAEAGRSILEAARRIVISENSALNAPCGGKGLCGRCAVRLIDGRVSPPSRAETGVLSAAQLAAGFRLACQCVVEGPLRVEIPAESLTGRQELQTEGIKVAAAPAPVLQRLEVRLAPSSLARPFCLWQQALAALENDHGIPGASVDLDLLRATEPAVSHARVLTVSLRGSEVINAFPTSPAPAPLGLAVDLGTTKIAGFLVDLESGATLAAAAAMNPQIPYGEDVMSRLAHCDAQPGNGERLAQLARRCIAGLLRRLLAKRGAESRQVEEAVIVGNTAMHHLLLGLPVGQLARSPFLPAIAAPLEIKARELSLPMAPGARVYCAPCVAGFVGGDHVAMILGSRMHSTTAPTLGIDIGTNTEIVLATPGELISCSCASGPAFEGAHIQHGMRAVDGAISAAAWNEADKRLTWRTIGAAPPLGLCGSGVIDAIAELIQAGVINTLGIIDPRHPAVRPAEAGQGVEILVVPRAESGIGRDITLSQADVGAIQLAKAAIRSGIELLLAAAGLTAQDLAGVRIAGAFGSSLDVQRAIHIGLVPALPPQRFHNVGNAAGSGARLALISRVERTMAERIARATRYLELTSEAAFHATFARCLTFPGAAS